MSSTLTSIELPIPSNLTGVELTTPLPRPHVHDEKQAQRRAPMTPSDILVQFEEGEVSQMINMCSLLRTKVRYPQASIWGPSEILQVQELYDMLKPKFNKLDDDRALFTDLAELDKLGIQLGRFKLARKPKENITTRVAQTNKLGENEHWSASGLMSHLSLLERIVSQPNEAPATQLWVNSFFFRVAAMLPPGRHMVLKLEQADTVLPLSDVPGSANWIALLTSKAEGNYIRDPLVENFLGNPEEPIFFVSERRHNHQELSAWEHVLPTIRDMHKWARTRGKSVIRGAVTDGREWVFLILKLDQRGGGVWMESGRHDITGFSGYLSEFEVALIPSILMHWMMHSHEDLEDDDYFVKKSLY